MKRLVRKGSNEMKVIYAQEEFPSEYTKSIFLAGPTPRDNNIESWRNEALEILKQLKYDGAVFIPESKDGKFNGKYDDQVEWEKTGLNKADCIVFWIPRDLETMPAFTTNIEWGMWNDSGKVVIGFPKDSEKNTYIEKMLPELQLKLNTTLEDTLKEAIDILGEGSLRKNAETDVPLYIWKSNEFQSWYKSHLKIGNELRYAKVNYVFVMPKARKVFLWILHVHVYIKDEDRIKENEFVLSRTDICSAVLYKKGNSIEDTEIVLVKEFRSPVNNDAEKVYELPGGSSNTEKENIDVIHDEIKEEIGIDIDKTKLELCESRQMVATLSAHRCHLYKLELDEEQMNKIKEQEGIVHGVEEDTERTYVEVFTVKEILSNNLLDWSNIGQILSVLNEKEID
jgi:8-oxo-dGTP pyrophosphatase MutT (NUDIX family)/nucleoside 2-deoxyribosyltransferase